MAKKKKSNQWYVPSWIQLFSLLIYLMFFFSFMTSFIHSSNRNLLSAYYKQGFEDANMIALFLLTRTYLLHYWPSHLFWSLLLLIFLKILSFPTLCGLVCIILSSSPDIYQWASPKFQVCITAFTNLH